MTPTAAEKIAQPLMALLAIYAELREELAAAPDQRAKDLSGIMLDHISGALEISRREYPLAWQHGAGLMADLGEAYAVVADVTSRGET